MRTLKVRRSSVPVAIAVALIAALFLFATPQPASAHDSLVASDPAADSTVDTLPAAVTLTFSAALIDGECATVVEVKDAAGNSVTDGAAELDGAFVSQPLLAQAEAGEYHVTWRVVSSDGHPTDGEFSFTVATSTVSTDPAATDSAAPAESTPADSNCVTSGQADAQSDAEGTPADADAFVRALPWIVGGILVAAGGGALVYVLVARSRRSDPSADSDTSTEG